MEENPPERWLNMRQYESFRIKVISRRNCQKQSLSDWLAGEKPGKVSLGKESSRKGVSPSIHDFPGCGPPEACREGRHQPLPAQRQVGIRGLGRGLWPTCQGQRNDYWSPSPRMCPSAFYERLNRGHGGRPEWHCSLHHCRGRQFVVRSSGCPVADSTIPVQARCACRSSTDTLIRAGLSWGSIKTVGTLNDSRPSEFV